MARPIYVGVGECDCKRIDVRLYRVPGEALMIRPICGQCLKARGYEVPKPRTAEDYAKAEAEEPPHYPIIDLGQGHTFQAVLGTDNVLVGWLHTHPDARHLNEPCQSFCAVRPLDGVPVHKILSEDPLTLTPSLRCRMCGAHGEVTNGRWEPK